MASTSRAQAASSPGYQYTSLSPEKQEFRVLILLPAPLAGPLVGCIRIATGLNSDEAFDAMSYCWGAPERSNSIRIVALEPDDSDAGTVCINPSVSLGTIAVTASVDDMLRSVRSDAILRCLWIDQICINQEDMAERSSQVKMMHIIYMKANTTVIWLGCSDEDTELGLQAGHALAAMEDQRDEDLPGRFDAVSEPAKRPQHWPPPPMGGKDWSEIETRVWQTFVDRVLMYPWFERTWVIQELALSARPVVKIGGYLVKWDDMWTACDVIVRGKMHATDPWRGPYVANAHHIGKLRLERMELTDIWRNHPEWTEEVTGERVTMHSLAYLQQKEDDSQEVTKGIERLAELQKSLSLASLLPATRNAKATDPKDKVFALLNISTTGGMEIIDYSRSLRSVYLAAAAEWASSHGMMEILDHVDTAAAVNLSLDIPAWLPLWHIRSTISLLDIGNAKAGIGPLAPDMFPPEILWDKEIVPFAAIGLHILTVKDVQDVKVRDVQGDFGSSEVVADGRDHAGMISAFEDKYPMTGERYIDCYPKVINPKAKDFECHVPNKTTFSEHKLRESGKHDELGRTAARITQSAPRAHYAESELVHSLPFEYHGNRFMMQGKQCTKRLFFTTTDGFMGLCSIGVHPGDKVCVLFGGRLLYILRETEFVGRTGDLTLHLFMGNCYVYGLMNGEALEGYEENETELFTLA